MRLSKLYFAIVALCLAVPPQNAFAVRVNESSEPSMPAAGDPNSQDLGFQWQDEPAPGVNYANIGPQPLPGVNYANIGPQPVPGFNYANIGPQPVPGVDYANIGPQPVPGFNYAALGPQTLPGSAGRPTVGRTSRNLPGSSSGRTTRQISALAPTTSGMVIFAPGNLSLMEQYHRSVGGVLPKTTLDSFVARSGYSDLIYGDEGTDGPPPYSGFTPDHYIENGIESNALTTGHHDRSVVSSWDYTNTPDSAQKLP